MPPLPRVNGTPRRLGGPWTAARCYGRSCQSFLSEAVLGESRMADTAYESPRMRLMADDAGAEALRDGFETEDEAGVTGSPPE